MIDFFLVTLQEILHIRHSLVCCHRSDILRLGRQVLSRLLTRLLRFDNGLHTRLHRFDLRLEFEFIPKLDSRIQSPQIGVLHRKTVDRQNAQNRGDFAFPCESVFPSG